jgi:hypothetical protein
MIRNKLKRERRKFKEKKKKREMVKKNIIMGLKDYKKKEVKSKNENR